MKTTTTARLITSAGVAVALLAATALPAAAGGDSEALPAPAPASSIGADSADSADTVDFANLYPYIETTRSLPGSYGHDYRATTSTSYWSVVATKPLGRANVDLKLYDDDDYTELLETSTQSAGRTDFIAMDSNHRALGASYPKVMTKSGSGKYRVEFAHGSDALDNHGETVDVSSTDVVLVRDTWLVAGEEYVFGVGGVPGVVLYLMKSDPSYPTSWEVPRALAVRSTPTSGYQIFSYTPTRSDWYGVVVTLPGVAGEVTMFRFGGDGPT